MPLAFFFTFRTYGMWLPGNENGTVDDSHNVFDTPLLPANKELELQSSRVMKQPAYLLDGTSRQTVCEAIQELASEKGWHLLAVQVRTNHVHLVIQGDCEPGRMMSDLKSRASRELNRQGLGDPTRRRWARHGSTRHLFKPEEVARAIDYTLDEQGERMAWYSSTGNTTNPPRYNRH